jgi:hypothetical protein
MGRLLRFLQSVTTTGYKWVRAKPLPMSSDQPPPPEDLLLTDGIAVGEPRLLRVYNALAKRGLFREFAELWVSLSDTQTDAFRERCRAFANRYGLLGVEQQFFTDAADGENGHVYIGEPLRVWTKAVQDMHDAVDLWDRLNIQNQDKRKEALGERIHWTENEVIYRGEYDDTLRTWTRTELIAKEGMSGRFRDAWDSIPQYHGLVLSARWVLQGWVTKALQQQLNGRLLWTVRPGKGLFQFHFEPANLLACMWCQLASEIAGEPERLCEHCGKPITDALRTSRRYCSNSCRVLACRGRKALQNARKCP